jgi:hypothetical protein
MTEKTDRERIKALRGALKSIAYLRPAGPVKIGKALTEIVIQIEDIAIAAIQADTTAGVMAIRAENERSAKAWEVHMERGTLKET